MRKQFFLKIKKLKFICFFIFLFFCLSIPNSTQALTWLPAQIANHLVAVILQLVIALTSLLLMLGSWLLNWVTSPSFIGVKFTANPFVTPAWTLVRDFANMGFILALVITGLGTALDYGKYQISKILPMLLIMALAINFSPVICGLFIDISNIIMNFFLDGVDFTWAVQTWREMSIALANTVSAEGFFEVLGAGIGMITFNLIAGSVFICFAFLFAARYVALWIAVILSPLAFFCFILPDTKSVWTQWWDLLIQWCFIGVQASFWIYLGYQMMAISGQITGAPLPDPEFAGISAIMGYLIPIIFLAIGLAASVSTSAQGADIAIGAFQSARGKAISEAKSIGSSVYQGASESTRRAISERIPSAWRESAETRALRPVPGTGETGVVAALKRTAATPWYKARQKVLQPLTLEPGRKEIDELIASAEKESVKQNLMGLRKAGASRAEKIAYLNALARKDGGVDEAMKEGLTNEEIKDIFAKAIKAGTGHYKDLIKSLPDTLGSTIDPTAMEGILAAIKPDEVAKINAKELKSRDGINAIVKYWNANHMEKVNDNEILNRVIAETNQQFENIVNYQQAQGDSYQIAAEKALKKLIEQNRELMRWRLTSIQAQASSGYVHAVTKNPASPTGNAFTDNELKAIFRTTGSNPATPPPFPSIP
ncbi:MAG: hypothetical protein ISS87_00645 [Candidatus Pacebacteria bacterium]|nr:hypothetical protein [Candidatus Paceibacterota bacterium]